MIFEESRTTYTTNVVQFHFRASTLESRASQRNCTLLVPCPVSICRRKDFVTTESILSSCGWGITLAKRERDRLERCPRDEFYRAWLADVTRYYAIATYAASCVHYTRTRRLQEPIRDKVWRGQFSTEHHFRGITHTSGRVPGAYCQSCPCSRR